MKQPINNANASVRPKPAPSTPVSRPVIANSIDVTKITGVPSGNQALHDFAARITEATKGKSNTVTLTLGEANLIIANLAEIVLANKDLQDQVFALQTKLIEEKNSNATIVINADGGEF